MKDFHIWIHELLSRFVLTNGEKVTIHHEWNYSQNVTYPYIVYNSAVTPIAEGEGEILVRLHMFDQGRSKSRLLELEEQIRKKLDRTDYNTKKANYYVRVHASNDTPTGDNMIVRRDLDLVIKIDRKDVFK